MSPDQLTKDYNAVESVPVKQSTRSMLQIRLAYLSWNDGASWSTVEDLLHDDTMDTEMLLNLLAIGYNVS